MRQFTVDLSRAQPYGKYGALLKMPEEFGDGNTRETPNLVKTEMTENGIPLRFPASDDYKVARFGRGRFAFLGGYLYFSASDNTNVFENGREYVLSVSDAPAAMHTVPDGVGYPNDVGIEITNICNARCYYCPLYQTNENNLKYPRGYMDMGLFRRIIDELSEWPVPFSIYLNNGGDPLVDKFFFERLEYCVEKGVSQRILIQTNAELLSEAHARAILDAGVNYLIPAFDGATAETYEKHRINCHFDIVLENIRRFARLRDEGDYGTSIQIKFMRTRANEHEMLDCYNMFNAFLSPELDHFQQEYTHTWNEDTLKKDGSLMAGVNSIQPVRPCRMAYTYFPIFANGDIGACSVDYNCEVMGVPMGNAARESLIDIWKGPAFTRLRKAIDENISQSRKGRFARLLHRPEPLPEKCRDCYLMFYDETGVDNILPEDRFYFKSGFSSYLYNFKRDE